MSDTIMPQGGHLPGALLCCGCADLRHVANQNEIDIVGTWDNRVTLAGECKWTSAPVGMGMVYQLRRKTIGLEVRDPVQWVLASCSGFEPEVRRRAEQGDLLLIEPDDLFDPELERPV